MQPAKAFRRGCNQNQNSKRAQLQARRAELNYALDHQMKLLRGAENLYRATGNTTVKSTVSLELSFVEAAVEILKNEIVEINGTLNVYQSVSETISMPMIPLGIKETKAIDFTNVLNDFMFELINFILEYLLKKALFCCLLYNFVPNLASFFKRFARSF